MSNYHSQISSEYLILISFIIPIDFPCNDAIFAIYRGGRVLSPEIVLHNRQENSKNEAYETLRYISKYIYLYWYIR